MKHIKELSEAIGRFMLCLLVGKTIGFLIMPLTDKAEILNEMNSNAILLFVSTFFILAASIMGSIIKRM